MYLFLVYYGIRRAISQATFDLVISLKKKKKIIGMILAANCFQGAVQSINLRKKTENTLLYLI